MEARVAPGKFALTFCCLIMLQVCVLANIAVAATYQTPNFIVHAPTDQFARQVGQEAERFRRELAIMWVGHELPRWKNPCPINVRVGQIGAGGDTTFSFYNGEVFGWKMNVQGSEERILDSVLPHEITHTILACRFRQPLPRWADEGMCTLVEHESEQRAQRLRLADVLRNGRKIPMRSLFAMKEYPSDHYEVLKLYAQGYSVTDYLVQQGGRETFLQFLTDALRHGSWEQALMAHYGINTIDQLESKWSSWVMAGSPRLDNQDVGHLAINERWRENIDPESVVRGQSPDASLSAPSPVQEMAAQTAQPSNQAANQTANPNHATTNPLSSAPRFNETSTPATTTAAIAQNSQQTPQQAAQHQAARSRDSLHQPVFFVSGSAQAMSQNQSADQRNRGQLQLTREGYNTPQTPVGGSNQVQPFTGGGQTDPFVK